MGARALPLARRAAVAAAVAAAFGALSADTALAQEAKPVPGCAGLAFTDPRGDQVDDPLGLGLGSQGPANVDVTGGFFRSDGGVVTANIQIADLTMDVPEAATGVSYYMYYSVGDALRFVSAESDGETVAYSFGRLDPASGLFTTEGETRGRLFPGPDGVVQVEVPPPAGGSAGTTLASPYAESDSQTFLLVSPADQAPDNLLGQNFTVGACAEVAPPGTSARPAVLPLRLPAGIGSASRASRTRSLAIRVRATRTIASLRVVLRRRDGKGPALARGARRRLRGTATLRLRVLRPLRPGRYSLQATGVVTGRRMSAARRVTLRR